MRLVQRTCSMGPFRFWNNMCDKFQLCYADIFYNNCFKNGILPIVLNEEKIKDLSEYSNREEEIEVNLKDQKIIYGNTETKFKVDSFKKKCLLEGLDDIALSLKKSDKIKNFEKDLKVKKPWIFND